MVSLFASALLYFFTLEVIKMIDVLSFLCSSAFIVNTLVVKYNLYVMRGGGHGVG